MTERIYYFAYGSNLLMEQMAKRCPGSLPYTQGILRDYRLVYKTNVGGRGVADVIKAKGNRVYGAIYEITKKDLEKLDKFEGRPYVYDRHNVTIETRKGLINCIAYLMEPMYEFGLPNVEYFKKIFNGYSDWALPQRTLTDAYTSFKKEVSLLPPSKKSYVTKEKANNNNKSKSKSTKKNSTKYNKPVYKTRTPIGYEPAVKWIEN